eukprot:s10525_g1.t1
MAQYRGAVLSPKDLVSLGNEPFKCGLVGMVEDLPSPSKVGFPHHFGEETEIMQMLPLLSAEDDPLPCQRWSDHEYTEPLVNMMVPLRYSISARATNMVQYAQNQEMAPGWQGYATAVILCLASAKCDAL